LARNFLLMGTNWGRKKTQSLGPYTKTFKLISGNKRAPWGPVSEPRVLAFGRLGKKEGFPF